MTPDVTAIRNVLTGRDLLGPDCQSAFLVGSLARGWGNSTSDVDIYVVCDKPRGGGMGAVIQVPLDPTQVTTEVIHSDGRRWEIKYWTSAQARQMLDKVSWQQFEAGASLSSFLSDEEERFLERLRNCIPVTGEKWVTEQRNTLDASAFRAFLISDCLGKSDDFREDALGQLRSGDLEAAILSAKLAFGHAIDGLLVSAGEYGRLTKWRARRFRTTSPQLPFELYWNIETMRTYDPVTPGHWVEEVLALCKSISMEVEIG
ncbi:nucleotidyltransferase domain-containing protein [Streptomyces sp. NPDC059853]|uniref:nucleotidyltransferase domain-containing protein n=1 Tax=Streptomyces sp. NPDC059853 TaxID=3346973 RepID=UPI003646E62D